MTRLSFALLALALFPAAAQAAPLDRAQAAIVRDCERIADAPVDISDASAFRKVQQSWLETCGQAYKLDGENPRVQLAMARALSSVGKRPEAIELLRKAAAQNNADAAFNLYDTFDSYDRSDVTKPQLIKRAEAEQALRKAAELGRPNATLMLAVLLDRGATVKRDSADAIYWAEQAATRPDKDMGLTATQVLLGRLLVKSDKPEQRAHGIALLQQLANNHGDAQAELAKAIRAENPTRARALLETALRTYPGHAMAPLTDMLIKGEGGPKDEKRAVSLLMSRTASDVPSVRAARGRLYLEGRGVPRDIQKAVELIDNNARWNHDARLEVMGLLAKNPDIRVTYPGGLLYQATEAAELGEPGAMAALIELKLSGHSQFGDKAGGCELAARAARSGDAEAAKRPEECRAN